MDLAASVALPFYIAGGTLSREAPSYIVRQADTDLFENLRDGEYCYVLNSRQMGKSSLSVRTRARLQQMGIRTALLDLTKLGGATVTAEQWYLGLLAEAGRELSLRKELVTHWKEHLDLSLVQRFFGALQEVTLAAGAHVVIFVDEIDMVRSLTFSTDEFFAAIRQCYVGRADDPNLNRLSFCLLGTATPSDLIQDTRTTPFNIGRRVELNDFTAQEAHPLAVGLGSNGKALLKRVLYWTGGHPYLTQLLCRALVAVEAKHVGDVDAQCKALFLTHKARESDDNLMLVRNRLLKSEVDLASLLELYAQLLHGKRVPYEETIALCPILRLSGVAKVESGLLKVRNRIYAEVFDRAWVQKHMPDAELRRQQAAYRRGLVRAVSLSGLIILALGVLSIYALLQKKHADDYASRASTRAKSSKTNADRADQKTKEALRLAQERSIALQQAQNSAALAMATAKQRDAALKVALVRKKLADLSAQAEHKAARAAQTANGRAKTEAALAIAARSVATRQADAANRYLYLANMNLIQQANEVSPVQFNHIANLLAETAGYKDRGFEWFYWDRLCHLERRTFRGHTAVVYSTAFSPDGKRIVTGSYDETARVWDARTGKEILTLKGHIFSVGSVAFSPDGKQVVTGSYDNTAKTWDAATGKEIRAFKGHTNWVNAVAFSPDGKWIVTGSNDNTAKIWDAATGKELLTLKVGNCLVTSVAFSPAGDRILTGSTDWTAKVWDAQTGKDTLELKGHRDTVYSVAFSPDGNKILTGSNDGAAKIWNAHTGEELQTLQGHTGVVRSAAFSRDGKEIVTGSGDSTAKVWDAEPKAGSLTLKGHVSIVLSVAFSSDGKRILTGSADNTAKVWDAATGKEILTLKGFALFVHSVDFSPDGKRIVTGGLDNTAKVWDAATGTEILTLKGHTSGLVVAAFSPNGERIVTGSADGTAKVWDARTGSEMLTLRRHASWVSSVAYSPDGKRIVTGSQDATAKVWNAATGKEMLTLRGQKAPVTSARFSHDGKRIVTGSYDNTAKVWDAATGKEILTLNGHTSAVMSVSFSSDDKRILTGSLDSTAKVWDAHSGRETLALKGHLGGVYSAAFSPNDKQIVTGSADGTAKVWLSGRREDPDANTVAEQPDPVKRFACYYGSEPKGMRYWRVTMNMGFRHSPRP